MSTFMEKYAAAQKDADAALEAALTAARLAFQEGVDEVFAKFPKLVSFSWHQYTPHFNDGDACIFSVYTDYGEMEWNDGEEIVQFERPGLYCDSSNYTEDQLAVSDAVHRFLELFSTDAYEDMFGDHVAVTVKRDGIEISEYDHD